MSFGYKLASLRKLKNLTRKELAEILSISYPALSNYENNERFPDQEMLITIADYFDVSIDYLLGRTNIREPMENIIFEKSQSYYYDTETLDIQNLSTESQEELKKYIELLKMKDMLKRNKDNDELATLD